MVLEVAVAVAVVVVVVVVVVKITVVWNVVLFGTVSGIEVLVEKQIIQILVWNTQEERK